MYESPVSMTIRRVIEDSKNAIESIVCNAAFEMGIEIDNGELLKALMYDRDQYNNGYADGKADATPKWISVEERLPQPETKIYLIASLSPDGEQIVKTSVWAWDEIGEKGDWINWNVVTHWMPLPNPPEKES